MSKIYLVGGAVRDQILGETVKDHDWVVVGSTANELINQGFKPVGKDFPVFLHPTTKEEYALARTERKIGKGYHGFAFFTDPAVSLEDDLKRRDLTINAMAIDEQNNLIDPFNGKTDLENKVLKHVSNAFIEDPVRILRIARFAAKLPGFTIAKPTKNLIQQMITAKEIDALVYERVWQEIIKALDEPNPTPFFAILKQFKILNTVTKIWSTIPNFNGINNQNLSIEQKFWYSCVNQDSQHANLEHPIIPKQWREPAKWTLNSIWEDIDITAKNLVAILLKTDAYRRPRRFLTWIGACKNHPELKNDYAKFWHNLIIAYNATKNINAQNICNTGLSGPKIGIAILDARIAAVDKTINHQ